MTGIYWFQNDLRLQDNPGLDSLSTADRLLLVYFWPRNQPWFHQTGIGGQRFRFLVESLQALRDELRARGQDLLVLEGNPEQALPQLAGQVGADIVATSRAAGYYERLTRERVAARLGVPLQVHPGNTLLRENHLPFALEAMPAQFTPFRQLVESLPVPAPVPPARKLPPPPDIAFLDIGKPGVKPHPGLPIRGGTASGWRRLGQWTSGDGGVASYKETRDCLDGLDGSSTLSPWLAHGCLSAREVAAAISAHEAINGGNESTRWMMFELWWREFFYWRAIRDDVNLFRPGGAAGKLRRCTFDPRNFARWSKGDTNYPLVNALIRQLLATGWMSNRGRQVAASCLVNEYNIDWRYGAAFFEKHLIDFDVASNYGNWQYLAGVGADPRGGRHFNLEKQAAQFDPEGLFTTKWGGFRPKQPDYVTDAADWPLPGA
ncbi:MAG: DASH family cryptochrome [Gammaproteobacteria bacterium]|nr:DASH family cryptochrome [Gammaproteobacteria bacterium]